MLQFPPARILVPFEFSEVSKEAWHLASGLARRFDADLQALYVEDLLPTPAWEFYKSRLTPELMTSIKAHIRSQLGEKTDVLVEEGDPVVNILRLARKLRPDLLVMGTHGRTGLSRVWMGSVAEAVTRLSPVPVLTLRDKAGPLRSVLAPVAFTGYGEYGLRFAAEAAAALHARLTALHVVANPALCPNPEFRLRGMLSRLPESLARACKPQIRVMLGDPTEKILLAAKTHDLVALVAHRKSIFKDMILGTTAERVLRLSPVPVLAAPAPKPAYRARPSRRAVPELLFPIP